MTDPIKRAVALELFGEFAEIIKYPQDIIVNMFARFTNMEVVSAIPFYFAYSSYPRCLILRTLIMMYTETGMTPLQTVEVLAEIAAVKLSIKPIDEAYSSESDCELLDELSQFKGLNHYLKTIGDDIFRHLAFIIFDNDVIPLLTPDFDIFDDKIADIIDKYVPDWNPWFKGEIREHIILRYANIKETAFEYDPRRLANIYKDTFDEFVF